MSNEGFADWGELLGDTVIATAGQDRLLHHSHVINIRGDANGRLMGRRWGTSNPAKTKKRR